jgi:tetratricopeptide (TPR) repeat protein
MTKKTKNLNVIGKPEKKSKYLEKITKFPFPYIIIIILTFAVYFQTLFYGFINLDDDNIIKTNLANVNNISVVKEVFLRDIYYTNNLPFYRPLLTLSLIFNKVTTGDNLFYFHLTNLILHIIFICLLFNFLKLIKINKGLALLLSLIYAVHPLFVNAVVWLVARDGLLANIFLISSFIMLIKYENKKNKLLIIYHLLFFALALYSKELALIAPLMFIIYLTKLNFRGLVKKESIMFILLWTLLIVPYMILRSRVITSYEVFGLSNILTNLIFIPEILCKFFIPYDLSGIPTFNYLLAAIGLIIALIIGIITFKYKENENFFYLVFGLIWVFVFSFPGMITSYVKFGGFDYVENRAYLPMAGIAIFLGTMLNSIPLNKRNLLLISIPILLILGIRNITYSNSYSDPLKFYNTNIEKGTKVAIAYYNRGVIKDKSGDKEGAMKDYNRSIELNPDYPVAYYNRGILKDNAGDKAGAVNDYNRAIELKPDYLSAYYNRGIMKMSINDNKGAIEDFDWAIELKPDFFEAYSNRGNSKLNLNDLDGALSDFNAAINIHPNAVLAYNSRGNLKSKLGDKKGAINDYNKAIEINPNNPEAYNSRGMLRNESGDIEGAKDDFNKAIKFKTDFADAYNNLGACYISVKDFKNAISCFEKAVSISPNFSNAAKNLESVRKYLRNK